MAKIPDTPQINETSSPKIVYFQSESQKNRTGRKVLASTRKVYALHVLVWLAAFFVGLSFLSQMGQSRAAANYRISPIGNDANSCSQSSPCRTMNRAYQVASPGDTVEIAGGTYGDQTITGTKSSWIYFRPVSGASVKLGSLITNANFLELRDASVSEWKIEADNIHDVTMRNVTVKGYLGYSGKGIKKISMYGGSVGPGVDYHPQIAPSSGNGSGWASDLLFDGVLFHDWTRTNTGVHIECLQIAGTTNTTIRNSTFKKCAVFDLSLTEYNGSGRPTNVVLENNFFGDTTNNGSLNDGYYALNYGGMNTATIKNNTFAQGINENTGNQNVTLTGNILATAWNCLDATYLYNVYQWTSNLNCSATDKWVNGPQYSISNLGIADEPNDDLHLKSSSPARDFISASSASSLGLPGTDIDGQSRPIGGSYDAGADEYGTGGTNSPPPSPSALQTTSTSNSPSQAASSEQTNNSSSVTSTNQTGQKNTSLAAAENPPSDTIAPQSQESALEPSTVLGITPPNSTKGRLLFASIFAALITALIATVIIGTRYFNWHLRLPFKLPTRNGSGPTTGGSPPNLPTGMISG